MTMTTERDTDGNQARKLETHVRERACDYYPRFGRADVRAELINNWPHNNSHLYRFELTADVPAWRLVRQRRLFVKVPTACGATKSGDRPYLIPETDPAIKFGLYSKALKAIRENFERVNDPRYGSVRILELLPDSDAIVMDEVPGETIRRVLTKGSRLRFGGGVIHLEQAFDNIGGWLRLYHAIHDVDGEVINDQREEFIRNIRRFTDFLGRNVGDRPFFRRLAEDVATHANALMPEELPLGLRFGEFGLTNILVEPDARVTAIGTLARWRAPIYEDIACFLTGLKAYNLQVFTQGLAFKRREIVKLEQAFLSGYFKRDAIPASEIQLFEILRLLERWSALAVRNKRRSAVAGKLGSALANRFFRKKISDVLASVRQTASTSAPETRRGVESRSRLARLAMGFRPHADSQDI